MNNETSNDQRNDQRNEFLNALAANPLQTVAEYYASCLNATPRAVTFARDELNLDENQASAQRIGCADRSLGKRIPGRDRKRGLQLRDLLVSVGLYKTNGRETMRGRVTVPVFDEQKNIIGLRGYKIDPHADGPAVVTAGESDSDAKQQHDEAKAEQPESKVVDVSGVQRSDFGEISDNDDALVIDDAQIIFTRDDRRYRIRGLEKNSSSCQLKISLMVSRDDLVHLDALDLVRARSRAAFVKAAATELFVDTDIIRKDIGQLLLQLETIQAERIAQLKKPTRSEIQLTEAEQHEALQLLRDPQLLQRIVSDIGACGMVGEATNKLAGYLAATSRKLSEPLAIVIQSSSSAGKTSLMDAILAMMPAEDQVRFSGMTGQSLYYLDSDEIKHKILAISEDEGIAQASYALKLLQSEGELRHASVGRDELGNMATQEHHVEGPVQIMLTTTAMDIDEELVNRCLVLSVDETRNQTSEILSRQRDSRSFEMFKARTQSRRLHALHQNAQRLLRPLRVFNPFGSQLTFPDNKTRLRRDHTKYLTLIDTVALLHQHQRQIEQTEIDGESIEFISVQASDIAVANGIAGEVLGRSLDELAPQTRRLLRLLHEFVATESNAADVSRHAFRFTRRDVREATQWSDSQLHKHLTRLADLEYLVVHRGKAGRRFVYELLYQGEGFEGQPFLMGLIDPAKLNTPVTTTKTIAP